MFQIGSVKGQSTESRNIRKLCMDAWRDQREKMVNGVQLKLELSSMGYQSATDSEPMQRKVRVEYARLFFFSFSDLQVMLSTE